MQASPVKWVGGKSRLRAQILKRFPKHTTYVEVFAGAAWVLFGKDAAMSKSEFINDLNGDLANFYRCVRDKPLELIEQLRWRLISQEDYALERDRISGSEIERAARFYWKLKLAFGGKAHGSFGYSITSQKSFRPERLWEIITRAHERLKHVHVFSEDFEKLITRLDRPKTLFYCDPPYFGCEARYERTFTERDHDRLADALKNCQGSFLLSYNDHERIKELYAWATIERVQVQYSVAKSAEARQQRVNELLISNYELPKIGQRCLG